MSDVVRGIRAFHHRRDLTSAARAWRKPLVVISGDQDRTPCPSAALATAGTKRQFHLVENCGHYVNLERPAEFRDLVERAIHQLSDRP